MQVSSAPLSQLINQLFNLCHTCIRISVYASNMAAQASQSAQAGAHASSTSIPTSSGAQYVKASAPPVLRKTADGSLVGTTTSHGEKPVFCFDPLTKPGVLCLRVPTADDLSAGGQSLVSRVLTAYLRTSQEGVPIHWLLVINQSELATFQRRFIKLREPADAVTIEVKLADNLAARLQNPRYSVDKWPVLQMMKSQNRTHPYRQLLWLDRVFMPEVCMFTTVRGLRR